MRQHVERGTDHRRGWIGSSLKRPYAMKAAATPTNSGRSEIQPIGMDVTVAPAMMITRPQAATGVRNGEIRRRQGRTRPIAPNTSITPMKWKNDPGSELPLVISFTGMTNFITPANKKSIAKVICAVQSAIPKALVGFGGITSTCGFFITSSILMASRTSRTCRRDLGFAGRITK